jgi:hypothetical protein
VEGKWRQLTLPLLFLGFFSLAVSLLCCGRGGSSGVEVLEEKVVKVVKVVEVAASNKVPNPVPIQLR